MSAPTTKKKCKRPGCFKEYLQQQNEQGNCGYHFGLPIFHDTKKGWTCCNKIVYDWDQFQKLPTCTVGKHSDVKSENQQEFYKSSTVSNAANAMQKSQAKVIQDINQYNKQLEEKKKKEQQAQPLPQKKIFKSKDGKLKCVNAGCGKGFQENQNAEDSCHFHKGQAIFHDCNKFWSCCPGKKTLDWDQFMKLPTCCVGFHSPKFV